MLRELRHRNTGLSQALAALALLSITLRALVPAGYMLTPSAERFVTVTLCSAHGGVEVTLDRRTGEILPDKPAPKQTQIKDSGPCVFAAAAPLAPPMAAPQLLQLRAHWFAAPLMAQFVTPGRGLAAPPPWATGPPQQA